ANLGLGGIIETGSDAGYHWRKYTDGRVEIFASEEVVMGANKNIVFPIKVKEVIFITANDIGGYNGANAYTLRISNVTNSGFLVSWDRFNENGIWNKKTLYYHVIAQFS
ncbi:hypothetical protein ILP31_21170, partial [Pectobacterium punjabense]|uniref:hypothetical protein n=1 Tax=Pectobacterium punjabense TaxID=2108399 RepID=UPI003D9A4513|nr:hypothetical protein [Pectobacterium punjabense]